MALDQELVGRSYPPSAVYEVGRGKIAEFATAIGAADPVHRDADAARAAGYPDVIAPPTFAIVLTLEAANVVLDDPQVSLDYSRVVHGEQRFDHTRPIHAGDALTVTVTLETVRSAGGHDMITSRSDVATVEGEHVAAVRSTLVVRGEG
jgi:acyl dehydratase